MEDILRILEGDARTSPERLAQMTGRPLEKVREFLQEAEDDQVVLGYRTLVDWQRLGQEEVQALIEVKVSPQREVGFDAVAERIARFPEVRSLYLVSGNYDLAVHVVGRTIYDISAFVSEKVAPMEAVQGTVTHFLFKRLKENGIFLGTEANPSTRLPIAP